MRLTHLTFNVDPTERARALECLLADAPAVRHMKGCLAYTPFADPLEAGGIGIVQEWETAEDFAAYTASPRFAALGAVLRPMMKGAPVSRRFEATLVQTVN